MRFDNVMLPLSIAGVPVREAGQRVRAALDKVGLLQREKAMPVMLSGGEQQRLAIARAVVGGRTCCWPTNRPPTSTRHRGRRGAHLHAFNQVGVTVLIATHAGDLFPGARRLQLEHGRLLA
jgi:cell division transport system ATP-binding protein